MCTITFIPKSYDDFILTSNRDEAPGRQTFPPQTYDEEGVKLLYPKDALAGGSWIGISERKRVVCLMNGGFVAHQRKPYYRKSRGIVVKDLLISVDILKEIENYNFEEIEPFTVVLVDWGNGLRLFQLVWDGATSHFSEEPLAPQIWSSSPLYPEVLKKKRENWFSEFLLKTANPSEEDLLTFHKNAGEGDTNSNLIMDREFVKTKSITQIIKRESEVVMQYEDLETETIYTDSFPS